MHHARVPDDGRPGGDVDVHECSRGDEDVVADLDPPDDDGVRPDPHPIADARRPTGIMPIVTPVLILQFRPMTAAGLMITRPRWPM